MFKFNVKTQHFINISILLWKCVSVLFDHLQASIYRYHMQSVQIIYCRLPYYLQGVLWLIMVLKYIYLHHVSNLGSHSTLYALNVPHISKC